MRSSIARFAAPTLLAAACLAQPACAAPPSGQLTRSFSDAAGGKRSYYVALPADYDAARKYRLVLVLAGTATTGRDMHEWFGQGWHSNAPGLERLIDDAVFVYPDQRYAWDGDNGWALGPNAAPYDGWHDIRFIDELLTRVESDYSIDSARVFATGHSWGGDMTAVVGCYLGERLRAIVPVAANRPFWFGSPPSAKDCTGQPAVWTFFGLADDHFGDSSPNGKFGIEQNDFWTKKQACSSDYDGDGETRSYRGCKAAVKFTLYAGGQYTGGGGLRDHQPPDYFLSAVSAWFSAF